MDPAFAVIRQLRYDPALPTVVSLRPGDFLECLARTAEVARIHGKVPERDDADYQFVQAAVITYDFNEVPPIYDQLMKRLDRYCAWFDALLARTTRRPKPGRKSRP